MPTISPNSPGEFEQFDIGEAHIKQHRAIETALEAQDSTTSAISGIFTQIGLGGQTPGTSSTAATIKGFYRTATVISVGIPSMSTNSVTSCIVSAGAQMGNPIQPGVPIIASPQAALPAAVVLGNAYCLDTNSITFFFRAISGINATTTVTFHVFAIDTIP